MAEWVWRITLKNISRENILFTITYSLKDKNYVNLASDSSPSYLIGPGEKKTIQEVAVRSMPLDSFKLITESKYDIDYSEPLPWEIDRIRK
jgi:hypothetical protein